jgi:alpha-D-xyloside xylohydrolase
MKGDEIIKYKASFGEIPLFVKEGSIIPKYNYAQSTLTIDPSELIIDVYTGKDGSYELYEDDGVSEKFRTRNEYRTTKIEYKEKGNKLFIYPAEGNYEGAVSNRNYKIYFHGLDGMKRFKLNDEELEVFNSEDMLNENGQGKFWDESKRILIVETKEYGVKERIVIE